MKLNFLSSEMVERWQFHMILHNGSIFQTFSLWIVLFISFKETLILTNHDIHVFEEILCLSIFILCYNSSEIHFLKITIYFPELPQQ